MTIQINNINFTPYRYCIIYNNDCIFDMFADSVFISDIYVGEFEFNQFGWSIVHDYVRKLNRDQELYIKEIQYWYYDC